MSTEPGLRELKKRRTRQHIAEVALALFLERGFEKVPVALIARRAEVSEATVFNYFGTKEDLVYGGMTAFDDALIAALRDRPEGQPVLTAFRGFLLAPRGLLAEREPDQLDRIREGARLIMSSPSLLARERQLSEECTRSVAELIAGASAGAQAEVESWTVAHAFVGLHRALVRYVWAQALAGRTAPEVARGVRVQAERAFGVLERGLADYAERPVRNP